MYFKGKIWYFCALMKFRKKLSIYNIMKTFKIIFYHFSQNYDMIAKFKNGFIFSTKELWEMIMFVQAMILK